MTEPETITIIANGKNFQRAKDISLEAFLISLNLKSKQVVVEYNQQALTKKEAQKIILKNSDQLEIAHIIAGG